MWRLLRQNMKTNPLTFQAGAFPAGTSGSSSQRVWSVIQACVLGIGQGKWLFFQASACLLHPVTQSPACAESWEGEKCNKNPVFCPPLVPSIPPPPRGENISLSSSLPHLQPISILIQSPSPSFSTSAFLSLI